MSPVNAATIVEATNAEWLSLATTAAAYFAPEFTGIEPIRTGLINRTFRVTAPDGVTSILQCVNAIHPPTVHFDIAAITAHLHQHGVLTPTLLATTAGSAWVEIRGRIWRMLSYVDGDTRSELHRATEARSAGCMLARFHVALLDYPGPLHNSRLGVHDFDRHIAFLRQTLATRHEHSRYQQVIQLAERVLDYSRELPPLPKLPDRLVHGDPKIGNFIFRRGSDDAICLVDLDTLSRMPLAFEIGDALRSWCNPSGEDDAHGDFSLNLLRAAIEGYATIAREHLDRDEWRAFVPGTLRIQIELAARFCADALNESYFGWNPARYASCSEHNEVRAAGQLSAAQSLAAQRGTAEEIVETAFA
jgi:Ser/Thr protein kinase RdoA (MazF antagonist)